MADREANFKEKPLDEAKAWAEAADALENLMEYIPVEHFSEEGIVPSSIYAEAYPALERAVRECNQMAGLKARYAGVLRG